jgi:threonine dehydrogenase-like Zn-dependent dehydrogenase
MQANSKQTACFGSRETATILPLSSADGARWRARKTGRLDPSPVLDLTVSLAEIASAYSAMDQRQAIKVMVRP